MNEWRSSPSPAHLLPATGHKPPPVLLAAAECWGAGPLSHRAKAELPAAAHHFTRETAGSTQIVHPKHAGEDLS